MKYYFLLLGFALYLPFLQAQEQKVKLHIQQESPLYYKPLKIKATQLKPHQKVQFNLHAVDAKKYSWHSSAIYIADKNGQIDLSVAPSVGGSYLGIHPMGLFWSMKSKDYHQIATGKGFQATISIIHDKDTLTQESIYRQSSRELTKLGIQGMQKRDSIIANYYLPSSDKKRPAIIFLGGSGGNFRQERVSMYASEGFAVIDLKYFKGEGLPNGIIEIPLEYVRKAHQWLMTQEEIDPNRIGIIGRSRGSELAMLYATKYEVSFVIAQVPSNVVWFGWEDGKSSWTYQNKPFGRSM